METKMWILSGIIVILIGIFCFLNWKRDVRKEREHNARLSARNQAMLIDDQSKKSSK
jgi:preprotein translocase subunit YajC